jgi:predicted acyltransferase
MRCKLVLLAAGVIVLAAVTCGAAASPGQATPPPDVRPVLEWHVLGPLGTAWRSSYYRSQLEVDYLEGIGGERSTGIDVGAPVGFEGKQYAWQPLRADETGKAAFRNSFADAAGPAVFYAAALLETSGGPALLRLSAVSSQRVWLNGRQVTDILNPIREMETDTVLIPIRLNAGRNLLLLKVSQGEKKPAEFGAALLPGQTPMQHILAWIPFLLIIALWAAITLVTSRRSGGSPDADVPGRLVSLDALRGFDMFWITGGGLVIMLLAVKSGNYALLEQLDHQTWNGFHFWDLIFPLFLFIVGAAIPFAFANRLKSGGPTRALHGHVVKRALSIFAVGLLLAGGMKRTALADLRIAGVLQRIAICYLASALIYLHLNVRKIVWLSVSILLGYWAVMALVPVPGFGAGNYLPDLNLANWLDYHYLPGRMYQGTWDNEGILSSFPACVTCLLGVLTGIWLRSPHPELKKLRGLVQAGVALLVLGWIWHLGFPVNKLLWTSSYVLVAGGWSILLLALFYWVLDIKKWRRWSFPFVVIGANAIAVYAFAGFIEFSEVAARLAGGRVASVFGPYQDVWLALVAYLLVWGALYWLYKRRIFIKL